MIMETRLQRKKRYLAAHNWAYMNTDVLCSVFNRLPYVDLLHAKSLCRGWHEAVHAFKSFPSLPSFTEMPWLIYSPYERYEASKGRFLNFEENKTYPFNDLAVKKRNDGGYSCYCIGSSHDWLICLDGKARPFLLNPFTSQIIDDLPRMDLSVGVKQICGRGNKCCLTTVYGDRIDRIEFVSKAVLSSSPSLDENFYLVIIYGSGYRISFCKVGDTSWTKLHSNNWEDFSDILFRENNLYGIYKDTLVGNQVNLKVWGMNQDGFVLVEKKLITMPHISRVSSVLYPTEIYLVESQGSLLGVQRFNASTSTSGNLVDARFHVFKLGADQNLSERLTCLRGCALFVGKNQSISRDVRTCKMLRQDAIYFNCDRRHFSGVFNLKDDSFHRFDEKAIPTWVVPPPLKRIN